MSQSNRKLLFLEKKKPDEDFQDFKKRLIEKLDQQGFHFFNVPACRMNHRQARHLTFKTDTCIDQLQWTDLLDHVFGFKLRRSAIVHEGAAADLSNDQACLFKIVQRLSDCVAGS